MQYTLRIGTVLLMLVAMPVAAQIVQLTNNIDTSRLQLLYEQQLADPSDEFTQKLIDDERADIRNVIEDELAKVITPVQQEEYITEKEEELTKALDRQRNIVNALQERLRDRKVDLDLLKTEEARFYAEDAPATGATVGKFRLTRSYPELLAKKAVLEERITVLESLIALQNARLDQLNYDQRIYQFSMLIEISKYVGIVLLILLFERLFRTIALGRITNVDHRYTVTKFFTSFVYFVTLLWVLGVVFSKQPGLLASLAIVGAGLAIAMQDVVKDVLGWFLIMQHRLFMRGHRITVGSVTGEVVDYGLLRTTLLEIGIPKEHQSSAAVLERTGKILSLPNAVFITESITNHTTTSDFVRAEMRIVVTFESNWRKAQEICKQVIDDSTDEYVERDQKQSRYRMQMLYLPHRTIGNQVYLDIAADGVELTLRFTVPIGERRPIVSQIADKLLEEIGKNDDVNLAYATQRILAEIADKK